MDDEKKEQGKKCFIITPIGNDNSEIFRKAKGVIESVIKPVLQKNGFDDIKPAYEIMDSGMIGNQIINRIVNDDLVVTNLTGNNPNVMYELAVRHASAKPIIHICENGTTLPFDIKDNRTIFYTNDMLGVQELQSNFELFVKNIDYSKEYKDNPIYSAIKMEAIFKKMNDEGQQNIADVLQQILVKVSNFTGANNSVNLSKSKPREIEYTKIIVKCYDNGVINGFAEQLSSIYGLKDIYIEETSNNLWEIKLCYFTDINMVKLIDSIKKLAAEFSIEIADIFSS